MMAKKKRKSKTRSKSKDAQSAISGTPSTHAEDSSESFQLASYVPFMILSLVIVIWLWPVTLAGRRPLGGEITSVYLPKMSFYSRCLDEGRLPLWNETADFGTPALAEGQIGAVYPLHLVLYSLFSAWDALTASMVVHYILAAWFAYLCARGFGLSQAAAMLTGLTFVGQGFFLMRADQPWSYTTGCWLPLAVMATWRWLDGGDWKWLLGLILILGIQILAGHFQVAFFTIVIVLLLGVTVALVAVERRAAILRGLLLPVAIFAALSLAAIQLVPTAELILQADTRGRGYWYLASFSTPPLHLVNYFAPTFLHQDPMWDAVGWVPWKSSPVECLHYVGLVPFGLAIWATTHLREDKRLRIWVTVLLFAVVFSLGSYMTGFRGLIALPGFGWFTAAARWSIVCGLFLALLAGWGMDRIDRQAFSQWFGKFALVASIILAMCVGFIVKVASQTERYSEPPINYRGLRRTLEFLNGGYSFDQIKSLTPEGHMTTMLCNELWLPVLNLGLLALVALYVKRLVSNRKQFVVVLLIWTLIDLSITGLLLRRVTYVSRTNLTDSSPVLASLSEYNSERVVGLTSNLPMAVGTSPLAGAGTPDVRAYWNEEFRSEAMELWPGLPTVPPLARWGDWGSRLGREAREGVSADDVEFFRLGGIRALICGLGSNMPPPDGPLELKQSIQDPWLMEQQFGPGVFKMAQPPAGEWTFWEPPGESQSTRAWAFPVDAPPLPGTDPRALNRPPPARRKMLETAEQINNVIDSGDRVVIRGTVKSPSVLVFSDSHYPGWHATLHQAGKQQPDVTIERAFGRWRAVFIPQSGEFELEFECKPESVEIGRTISVCTLLLWILCFAGLVVFEVIRRRDSISDDKPKSIANSE